MSKFKIKISIFIFALILISLFSLLFLKTSFTISKVTNQENEKEDINFKNNLPDLPEDDPDRINILLLGSRGADEPGDGKLLSDSIILVSIKKSSGQIALISFPRDFYIQLWCSEEEKKINFAYAYGGLSCAKKTLSYLSGLHIDYAANINFEGLTKLIDNLGGINVYLNEPFEENFQWAKEGWEEDEHWFIKEIDGEEKWVFYLPKGKNYLDGQTALYYVRSRYSTNDFDRMRRQQDVLMAIKEKGLSLNVLLNPVKIYNLLDTLGNNIKTDMSIGEIKELINLSSDLDIDNIETRIFDISPEGLLYHTFINKEYVLLPVGDNFDKIQEVCKNIFEN